MSRTVQLAEITERPLPWTIGRAHGLDQRPIAVFLPVLDPLVLAKKHLAQIMAAQNLPHKRLDLHYNRFSMSGR
jgi:hypothetical protein